PDGLAHENLRGSPDQIVGYLADDAIAETLVEAARSVVERGDEEKDVRRDLEDPFLGPGDELRADSGTAERLRYADGLDVAEERAAEVQNDEAGDLVIRPRAKALSSAVAERRQTR